MLCIVKTAGTVGLGLPRSDTYERPSLGDGMDHGTAWSPEAAECPLAGSTGAALAFIPACSKTAKLFKLSTRLRMRKAHIGLS